ncbi:Uncharacterised protein [Mycobacteroides abscessus subsp. abscessus]|nr:Uncharacterised protein [Mycobacteroides abscessus subsp. abscessus]
MNETDLLGCHPASDQLILDRLVDGELARVLRRRTPVAEHDLQSPGALGGRPSVRVAVLAVSVREVDPHYLVGDHRGPGDFRFAEPGQAGIQRYITAVVGDLEDVVHLGRFGVQMIGPPAQIGNEVHSFRAGLDADDPAAPTDQLGQWHRYLIACDDIGVGVSQRQQFKQVGVLSHPCHRPQLGSGGVHFDRAVGIGERGTPVRQVGYSGRPQQRLAHVGLHHPQLPQRVGDRRPGRKRCYTLHGLVFGDTCSAGLVAAHPPQNRHLHRKVFGTFCRCGAR